MHSATTTLLITIITDTTLNCLYVYSHSHLTYHNHHVHSPLLLVWSLVEIHYEGELHKVLLFLLHPTLVHTFHHSTGLPTNNKTFLVLFHNISLHSSVVTDAPFHLESGQYCYNTQDEPGAVNLPWLSIQSTVYCA